MMDSSILDESREPLKLPAFEKAVMQSVTLALEVWRDEAMEGALPAFASILSFYALNCCHSVPSSLSAYHWQCES